MTLSGFLTAILYGFLRVAYSLFYREFGVTPEEVGLGQAEILAESLLGTLINFLFSVSLMVYILTLLSVTGILLRSTIQVGLETWADIHRLPRDQRRRTLMYLGLAVVATVLSLILINRAPAWFKTLMIGLAFAVILIPVGVLLIKWARGWVRGRKPKPASNGVRPGKETQPQQKPPRADDRRVNALFGASWFRALVVITALFALFVEASLLGGQAVADARAAKAGVARHPTFLGIPILGWGADPVTVAWLSGTPPQGLPSTFGSCLMYLGRADGIAVIYDVGARETIRVPSSAVMVTTASTRSSC